MSETDALEIFFKNDKTDEPANINEAVTNYSGKDDERICKFMLTRGSCPRKHCTYEHTPYAKSKWSHYFLFCCYYMYFLNIYSCPRFNNNG